MALANDMLTQIRQRVICETQGRRGRKTDPAWAARRRLLIAHERLPPEAFARMWNLLIDTGEAGVQILAALTDRRNFAACSPCPGPTPNASSSGAGSAVSTSTPPRSRHPHRVLQRQVGGLQPLSQTPGP